MKLKHLLLTALCAVCGSSAFAQTWTEGAEAATDKDFYLYNIESGMYVNHGSSWTTHVTVDGKGDVVTLWASGSNFKIHLSEIAGGKDFSANGWSDASDAPGLIFEKVNLPGYTNAYRIKTDETNGYYWCEGLDTYGDECLVGPIADHEKASTWLLIPREIREAKDKTYLIKNPDFTADAGNWVTGWTTNFGTHVTETGHQPWYSGMFAEKWTGAPGKLADMSHKQTITVPEGKYTLSVNAQAIQQDGNVATTGAFLFAGDKQTAIIGNTFATYSVDFSSTGTAIEIGVKTVSTTANWFSFDKFRLTYVGPLEDLTAYKADLESNLTKAKGLSADMNKDVAQALADAIEAAKNCEETKDALTNAIDKLKSAIANAEASIEIYKQIVAINTKAASLVGDEAANAYAEVLATYTNKTATTVAPFEAAYKDAAKVAEPGSEISVLAPAAWEGQSGIVGWANHDENLIGGSERFSGSMFTGDVMTMTINSLKPGTYTVTLYGAASTTGKRDNFEVLTGQNRAYLFANDALQSMEVYDRTEVAANTADKAVLTCGVKEDGVLKMGIENKTLGANWFVVRLESITYMSESLPTTDVELAVSEAQYSTFIAPFDAELPEGVKAYTVDGIDGNELVMTETSIMANTPVILFSENPVTVTITGTSQAEGATYTVGLLTGVYAPVTITAGYVLQNGANGVQFYKVNAEKPITVPANRAYLTTTSEAKVLNFPSATAISAIEALTSGKAEIYSINGAKQNKLQKGVNIVNGVKVLVK